MTDRTPAPALSIAGFWDAAADTFDDEPDHGLRAERTRAAWERLLHAWAPPAASGPTSGGVLDVLDVGCGTGSLSALLAASGHRVTGVDLAPRMVERARAKLAAAGLPGRFLVGDAADPPTGQARFDLLMCRHLLWTLPDPHQALRTWVSRLRPGGRLVLVEGRWGVPGTPYAAGAQALPWDGGVGADDLARAVRPLVSELRVEPLSADPDLWGGPVHDERYALLARL
ncbi:class I SAM-dependent methyltransferase [Nonomuraea sp. NN258]|uniref:class I SAM-dependent methyltransferase n=1 Tax=Nonomuraea antri TaxID=2730852 RepID=UPI00156A143F|nr:class I SAM-dependent methyltransferase [Nonomuraea antri]NRQ40472.1 class I SAM-dependent methyltransferase [Nonomuraea antri]